MTNLELTFINIFFTNLFLLILFIYLKQSTISVSLSIYYYAWHHAKYFEQKYKKHLTWSLSLVVYNLAIYDL